MEAHHISGVGTAASGAVTLASAMNENPDWRVVLVNAGITLLSGLVAGWLKSKSKGGEK